MNNKQLMKPLTILLLSCSIIIVSSFRQKLLQRVDINNLRCEMLSDPIGIDSKTPRLSWELAGDHRGIEQVAYTVIVSSSLNKLALNDGDVWNSGKVLSNASVQVVYGGKILSSRSSFFWKVKIWTKDNESDWSKPARWSMGLLNSSDWKAIWTGLDKSFPWDSVTKMSRLSARYFRKEFVAAKEITRATVYISGLGLYELYLNGQKIGNQVLSPSPTDYSKAVKYNTFDVTGNLREGANAIGTILGNGRFFTMRQNYKPDKWHTFGFPRMIVQLEIIYNDGSKQLVISDDSWKVFADGPIRTNNEYDGEEYDGTKEMDGWDMPSFNDGKWLKAQEVKAPGGILEAQMNENMKVMETVKPINISKSKPGVFIMDMGQNMAGWIKMKVKGSRGQKVTLRYAESLQSNGEIYTANLRDALVTDVYTLRGEGTESWSPRFVFHGFRYVEITNYPGTPTTSDFMGEVIYDNMQTTGSFETSDSTINAIHRNAYWGIRSNYKGMPIDCPQRNERQPWLGDRATGAYGESFIFDNSRLYAKWLDDIEEAQTAEGSIPDVAPSFWYYYKDNVTWPGTYLMIADMLYNQYADKQPIIKHYASMKKWMDYMRKKYMVNYLLTKDSYGDWCVPPESPELIHSKDSSRITDPKLLATATYYHLLELMEKFAVMVNKPGDKKEYASLSLEVLKAFNARFYHANQKEYSNNTVTANILPLAFNMVPGNANQEVFKNISNKIMNENNGHISTGVIGTQWLMRWLTLYGRSDIAYKLATNRDYPSWGYMVANGATTIWELWNGNTADPKMNSQNHVMLLGDLLVWMYEDLGGIKSERDHAGFKEIEMKPSFVDGLDHVKASYHSMYGLVKSEWNKDNKQITWNITVPGNSHAIIYVPARSEKDVTESDRVAASSEGIRFIKMENNTAVFEIKSGAYSFKAIR